MISKRVDRVKKSSDFGRLTQYVLNAKSESAEVMWTRTAEYVLDEKGQNGDKVLYYRISNCSTDVPAMAIAEVLATQAENTRTTVDKTYHCVVSFPAGEHPTREQMEDIEDSMCSALGLEEHQRVSAVHQDTDNIHLHLAISKIHPTTFRCVEPHRDYYKRDQVCREMERKHGLTVDNGIEPDKHQGKPKQMEARTGEQSLLCWIREHAKADLMARVPQAESWQEVHEVYGAYGLSLEPKGGGFVIVDSLSQQRIKASDVDKSLAGAAMIKRFGAYQNAAGVPVAIKTQYERGPKAQDDSAKTLYAEHVSHRNAAFSERKQRRELQQKERADFQAQMKAWFQKERQRIKNSANPAIHKRAAYKRLAQERKAAWEKFREKQASSRQKLYADKPLRSWDEFLQAKASQGDEKSLELLRHRKTKRDKLGRDLLTASGLSAAKQIIYDHLRPVARRNGDVVYQVKDGGRVTDEKALVGVDVHTEGAAFLALTLASERFSGQALDVQGSEAFKADVLKYSVEYGLKVRFKDKAMEAERQRQMQLVDSSIPARDNSEVALQAFVEARNALRPKVSEILPHRSWKEADVEGEGIYKGTRNLTDGSKAVLIEKHGEMLVKPVASEFELTNLKVGTRIQLSSLTQARNEQQDKGHSR